MADVAREASVSLMTVSRVINNKDGVSDETRRAIQDIIGKLGYRPSSIARSLATQRTGTLGLVVPDISNPFFSSVAHGVEQVAYDEGYGILLCNTKEDPQREVDVMQLLEEKRVDGILLCSPRLEQKQLSKAIENHPAVVLINRTLKTRKNSHTLGSVIIDDDMGGRLATNHLIGLGHRRIGFIAGPSNSFSGQRRQHSFQAALLEAGIPFHQELTRPCWPSVEGGEAAAKELINAHPEMTAIFCYNDLVAVGALQACKDLGLNVPGDLAIVGYDDIPLAALVTPPLTTCRVQREELGSRAAYLLLTYINGCPQDCSDLVVKPELVVRLSA